MRKGTKFSHSDVVDFKEISYPGRNGQYDNDLSLDIKVPQSAKTEKFPIVVLLHSGGFLTGSNKNHIITEYATRLSRKGYVTASVNYKDLVEQIDENRISPSEIIFNSVLDVRSSISYLIANADTYNIDTTSIFLLGFSAGGILALHTTYSDDNEIISYLSEKGKSRYFFFPEKNFQVKAVVSIGGACLDINHIEDSEIRQTPALLLHGEDDDMVALGLGKPFARYMNDSKYKLPLIKPTIKVGDSELSYDVELVVPGWIKRGIGSIVLPDLYGSESIYQRFEGFPCELKKYKDKGRVFMKENGTFNKEFDDSIKRILAFLKKNQ